MSPDSLAQCARDIAFVTFTMVEVLDSLAEAELPNGSRYHVFNGFMGFCDHAGDAGLALAKACDGLFADGWTEIVEDYARGVVTYAIANGTPASSSVLRRLGHEARSALPADGGAP